MPAETLPAFRVATVQHMRAVGAWLAGLLGPGDLVVLAGPLGAGKTVLVSGLAAGIGSAQRVTSPTFVLVHEHRDGRVPLLHVDAYRLSRPAEVADLDLDLDASVTVVEWGEGLVEDLGAGLPSGHLLVRIERPVGVGEAADAGEPADAARTVRLEPGAPAWAARLRRLVTLAPAAVLFDLDGVLADSTAAVERHWRDFAERHGLDPAAVLAGAHGRRSVDHVADLLAGAPAEFVAARERPVRTARGGRRTRASPCCPARRRCGRRWMRAGRAPASPWSRAVPRRSRGPGWVSRVSPSRGARHRGRRRRGQAGPAGLRAGRTPAGGAAPASASWSRTPPPVCRPAARRVHAVLGLLTSHAAADLAGADHVAEDLSAVLALDGRLWVHTTM